MALTQEELVRQLRIGVPQATVGELAVKNGLDPSAVFSAAGIPRQPTDEERAVLSDELRELDRQHGSSAPSFRQLQLRAGLLQYRLPTQDNTLDRVARSQTVQELVADMAGRTRPVLHERVEPLLEAFLRHKQEHGSSVERDLYKDMGRPDFLTRLLSKRPLMFMTSVDMFLLCTGEDGSGGFEFIGTDRERHPLVLASYLSYDEMQVAALVGVSVPTLFINKGDRGNLGRGAPEGSYQAEGVYIAQVGSRFERPGLMEWQHMVVTREQNVKDGGYGPRGADGGALLDAFAGLYGLPHFPTYEEVLQAEDTRQYAELARGGFFNVGVFKKRCELLAETFLGECSDLAGAEKRGAYCHAVGLGLGVWQVHEDQVRWMLEAYHDVLTTAKLPHVAVVDFSYFAVQAFADVFGPGTESLLGGAGNRIRVRVSRRDPAERLSGPDAELLLVCQYAWDANAYPGNEYWDGELSASGDPAAACCSLIPWLQNPDINPYGLSGHRAHVVSLPEGPMSKV